MKEIKLKILNLYAGIGGNRKKWDELGDFEITAVENVPVIAKIYHDFFPKDKIVIADAHQYLLDHYSEFDFIWSSPPCPSHSRFRFMTTKIKAEGKSRPIIYPDMKLYEEILLLKYYFKGKYCVENVRSYYKPLVEHQELQRHLFWANFSIYPMKIEHGEDIKESVLKPKQDRVGFDLSGYKNIDKIKLLRNCVVPELGKHILFCAFNKTSLF